MKKPVKNMLFIGMAALSLGIQDVNAKYFTPEEIKEISKFDEGAYENIYIFGSHVYFNKITMANVVAAANTLNGQTDAILYYKDGENAWTNAVTNEKVDVSNITFDITQITKEKIGDDDRITDIPTTDDNYVKTEIVGSNLIETFTKEEKDTTLKFNGMKLVNPVDIGEKSDYHTYNTKSLSIKSEDNNVLVTENAPLLSYNNGYAEGKWYGILVDLNKNLNDEEYKGKIGVEIYQIKEGKYISYGIEDIDITDAKSHGGNDTEFIMWLRDIDTTENATIIFTEYDEDKNIIDVERVNYVYSSANELISISDSKEHEIVVTTEGVNVSVAKIGEDYTYIFYGFDSTKEFELTIDGVQMKAYLKEDSWVFYQPMNIAKPLKGTTDVYDVENHKWNQSAIDVSMTESEEEGIDYVVTVTKNKEMINYNGAGGDAEWYSLIFDLGINPNNLTVTGYGINPEDISDAKNHGATTDTAFVMWMGGDYKDYTFTFKNNESQGADEIVVKFVVVDEIPELELNVNLANKDTQINVGEDYELNETQRNQNGTYIYNMHSLSLNKTYKSDEDTYYVDVKANRVLESFVGGESQDAKWYAVIADFGVNPKDLKVNGYTIEDVDIKDATRWGAESDTAFVMWLKADDLSREIVVTNKNNNDVVNVIFKVTEVEIIEDKIDGEVVIAEAYQNDVTYEVTDYNKDGVAKNFIVSTKINKFEFSVGNDKFTYTKTGSEWKKAQSLELRMSTPGLALENYTDAQKYNQAAIQRIDTELVNDVMNVTVVMNRILDNSIEAGNGVKSDWYSLVFDLGVENKFVTTTGGYGIEETDKTNANSHTTSENASPNNIVIWLDAKHTDVKEGYTITFVNTENTDITYKVNVKTVYEQEEALTLTSVKEAVISEDLKEDSYYDEMVANHEGLTAVVDSEKTNTVNITTDKLLTKYNNGYAERAYFGILLDLGINPELISTVEGGYTIEEIDKTDANRFGGSETEFVLWLDKEAFAGDNEYEITFTNLTETNKFNTLTVKFTYAEEFEELNVVSVKKADIPTGGIGQYSKYHALNQESITVVPNEDNTKISITTDGINASYNNGYAEGKWFSLLVDLGVNPKLLTSEQYGIEEIDYTDAARHGATNDTTFVMWLTLEQISVEDGLTITFTNTYNGQPVTMNISNVTE